MSNDASDSLDDPGRLAALEQTERLDKNAEEAVDRYARIASRHLDVPISLVSAVYPDRQLFKSCIGLTGPLAEGRETPVSGSICKHVVQKKKALAIEDAREHPLVKDNPSVTEHGVVAYLGAPLVTPEGYVLGSFCAIDLEPRSWDEDDVFFMETMADAVMSEIQSGRFADEEYARLDPEALLGPLVESSLDGVLVLEPAYAGEDDEGELEDFVCRLVNEQGARMLGHPQDALMGERIYEYFDRPRGSGLFNVFQRVVETGEPHNDTVHYDREDIQGWFDVTITAWTGGVVAHFHDVSDHKEAQEALRESEERFRMLAENTSDVLVRISAEGELTYVSPASRHVLGMEPEVLKERATADDGRVHPEDREIAEGMIEEVLQTGSAPPATFRYRHDDGSYQWLEAQARGVEDPETGEITEIVSALRDVTERKEREQELERIHEQRRLALEAGELGTWNYDYEADTVYWDEQCRRIFGVSTEEKIDFDKVIDCIHPEDQDRVEQAIERALDPGESSSKGYEEEYRVVWPDESVHWVVAQGRAYFEGEGETRRAVRFDGTVEDITERVKMRKELQESEERFRMLAENTSDVLARTTAEGEVTYVSPASRRVLAMEPEEMIERSGYDLIHPEDRDVANRAHRQILETGACDPVVYRMRHGDDGYRWIESRGRGIEDSDTGEITEMVTVLRDVTERRKRRKKLEKAQEEAQAASKAKSQFLANMSHELRTPLNAVIGYSEMVQEDIEADAAPADEPQQKEQMLSDLGQIHSAGEQLLALVNDVLDISKIEAGEMDLHPATFDLKAMVEDTADTTRPMIEEGGNEITVDCPEEIGDVYTDKTKVRQGLFNLLSNAAKFTENGEITLRARRTADENGDWVRLAVEDTGIGMTEEEQEEVFETFAQADTSLTREHEGTGLGLVITQNLCEMMGGRLDLDSEKDVGSTFTIHLPANMERQPGTSEPGTDGAEEAPAGEEPEAKPPVDTEVPEGKDVVLVIDDDERAREIVERRLKKEGFAVRTASSGKEGLEAARALKPTVITLDVMMPEMDGWAVLSALKDDEELQDIPVVMVTIVEDENMGYTLGAADYLTKPFDAERLARVMEKYRTAEDCSVMIVEDDEATRDLVHRTLEKKGCSARSAENGRVGLHMLTEDGYRPNVIILDLMMPEVDGFTFLEEMRRRDDLPEIPVVVVTAKDLTPEDHKRLNGGIDSILQKGDYGHEELLEKVRHRVTAAA